MSAPPGPTKGRPEDRLRDDRVGAAGQGESRRPGRRALPTRSLRDHPPHKGEGEAPCEAEENVLARVLWRRRSHKGQRAPVGAWRTWVFLGGRGAGKTRAGAEWVWETAQRLGAGGRIALVGPTIRDARTVMVEGPSGVLNLPFRTGAAFASSLRQVTFPGGAVGLLFSAEEPERLRGPQFHAAWGDEFCAWGRQEETLANLRLGLRLSGPVGASDSLLGRGRRPFGTSRPDAAWASPGAQAASDRVASDSAPQLVLTSTPKPGRVLRGVLGEKGCARTHAPTAANAKNLAPGFLAAMQGLYGGTRRAAQELDGRVLEGDGALFTLAEIEKARAGWAAFTDSPSPLWGGSTERSDVGVGAARQGQHRLAGCGGAPTRSPGGDHPPHKGEGEGACVIPFDRVVVAVDPPAGTLSGRARDACGIVVAGRRGDRVAVLADWTARGLSPEGWADRARRAVEAFGAGKVVVESNNGGAMAEAVLRASGLSVPVKRVHASVGKAARAEPAAALYEQGRVAHAPGLEALEEELMGLGGEDAGGASPDRADALVWAVTELMPAPGTRGPRVTQL